MSTTNPYAARPATTTEKVVIEPVPVTIEETVPSVPVGTISEILAWVDGDIDRARQALETELDGSKRKSLVATLEGIVG